ncbi:YgiQ family radical SAM protein [Methanolapillus millepedarum]|uniref:Radical SAM core domain-containing protein n=1 Tax=Methanolapillus millepedarum TaxID=3028296 RepID=A0AA96V381_9EURY|nr:hypothetical protein MsAc7_12650 [Methanosarcinaceae archaeon Ac7]
MAHDSKNGDSFEREKKSRQTSKPAGMVSNANFKKSGQNSSDSGSKPNSESNPKSNFKSNSKPNQKPNINSNSKPSSSAQKSDSIASNSNFKSTPKPKPVSKSKPKFKKIKVGEAGVQSTVEIGKKGERKQVVASEKSVGQLGFRGKIPSLAEIEKRQQDFEKQKQMEAKRAPSPLAEKKADKHSRLAGRNIGQMGVVKRADSADKKPEPKESDFEKKTRRENFEDNKKKDLKPYHDGPKSEFDNRSKFENKPKFDNKSKFDSKPKSDSKPDSKEKEAAGYPAFEERRRNSKFKTSDFLPMSLSEARQKGWNELDIILVSGDAYVDHSGFGTAIIGRVLENAGFRVGIIAQPDWTKKESFEVLGKPRLFFSVSAGNTDSLVNNYTPLLNKRESDAYSPGGESGLRPDRAVISYANRIREAYPDVPIVAGGIEASLRRFAEFDYLSNHVRQSILADAPIDLIVYGMGELQMAEIAKRMADGEKIESIRNVPGTVWKMPVKDWKSDFAGKSDLNNAPVIEIPSFSDVFESKEKYAAAFKTIYENQNPVTGKAIAQVHPKTVVVQNPPMRPLTETEMDFVYELPYARMEHPSYTKPVPGLDVVRFSITSHRGCFGGCSFCAITQHQGRAISNRSGESIVREARLISKMDGFHGIITGVGGPSANMYKMTCANWEKRGACTHKNCLVPSICPSLEADHRPLLSLLKELRGIPGIKKVFTGYGVRFDLAVLDDEYLETLCKYHVGGQLKVAPEHFCDNVTAVMRKPDRKTFETFETKFKEINQRFNLNQFLVTFQISGHPGCTVENAIEMAEYIRDNNRYTEQVQDFTPTPMTISTCMFHTGLDPFTMEKIHVPVTRTEKKIQRSLLQFRNPDHQEIIKETLIKAGREDLIGNEWKCLVKK